MALLRILLELRAELGVVLSVAHLHHGIRGPEADADKQFVGEMAKAHGLELHAEYRDALSDARTGKISVESAGRRLRHEFFSSLLAASKVDVIATAHTLDDQAETMLMKILRGAGTRGIAGIFPEYKLETGRIVRPLLEVRREQLREYLREIGQTWQEDSSNADVRYTRNRLRARVMPLLREQVNPAVDSVLANAAEIARAEEEYWDDQVKRRLPLLLVPGEPARGGGRKQTAAAAVSLDIAKLKQHSLALQRRLLRGAGEQLGCPLDFEHTQRILDLLNSRNELGAKKRSVEIESSWRARLLFRELRLERSTCQAECRDYQYALNLPGEVRLAELGTVIRARISDDNGLSPSTSYNRAQSITLKSLSGPLSVRNWRAGDRFQARHHNSAKRVKELLYPLHIDVLERQLWPVVAAGERIVWVRGLESPELRIESGQRFCIEESRE
ncbi:MAG: tRNA lysidine(34) synthetase TilS [Acidobacteria bacterium]|nr:tRNA lysidine(34) synthetase TilS [Acidobacteriota bacterium]MBV9145986.1 tRNA lysidine(34) synthetase TilS [Acidobacteriota bacterium]MBV9435651.1 tRNA lysidine(34) synthetase TilS [Acidobacteriota bacterium]